MSLEIFINEAASVSMAPCAKTISSCAESAANLLPMRAEGQSGEFRDLLGGALGEFGMRVQAGADGGAADGQIVESVEHLFEALDVALEQASPAAEFLADGERHGVLQVGAADLDDVVELLGLGGNGVVHVLYGGNQRVLHALGGGNVHGGRKRVVRRLRHVDVIVGMNRLLRSEYRRRRFRWRGWR